MTDSRFLVGFSLFLLLVLLGDLLVRRLVLGRLTHRTRQQARRLLQQADEDAATKLKEADMAAREEFARQEAAAAEKDHSRQAKLREATAICAERETDLDERARSMARAETDLASRQQQLKAQADRLETDRKALEENLEAVARRLEEVAGLSRQEAQRRLETLMVEKARHATQEEIQHVIRETRSGLDEKLRHLTLQALQRLGSGSHVESTVSLVRLPNDDMKGRIIGREGRNIRSIEMATGIDLIVDDTPGTILISCFDPIRRESARIAIERLVEDGRIHPARIEELVQKTKEDLEGFMDETGEAAAFELGIQELHPKLIHLLGRLKYHTLRGQNLLQHCRETADLAGTLAVELGLPPEPARRAGLLHEIAQAAADRPAVPSILASAEMAARHGESHEVREAIAATYPESSPRHLSGALVRLACHLSRSRVGARKQNLEIFVARMRRLEKLATSLPGVTQAHAFRAGRELRVLVESTSVTDEEARVLSRDIASRIEHEMDRPGQVRVSVLRETRAIGYAL